MKRDAQIKRYTRRDLLRLGGGALGAAALSALAPRVQALVPGAAARSGAVLVPEGISVNQPARTVQGPLYGPAAQAITVDLHMAASDGWISLPPDATVAPYHPDDMAPAGLTTYIFGFRDMTAIGDNTQALMAQKMRAQLTAPTFWINQDQPYNLKLTNLGLQIRPDLIDAHTLHFHGFRNAIPIFDGEPHSSVGVPIIRDLTYHYVPRHPGTYMYHCHFEETEHVHMGMIGVCYVKSGMDDPGAGLKYVYNDASTRYDRDFVVCLSEIWAEAHWCDSHVQLPEWSDYAPEFWLMNGRVYPDTLAPNGGGTDPSTGNLIAPPGRPDLQYQPISSLITCNSGDEVLLRVVNLGYEIQALRLAGIKARVVGRDATLLQGRGGTDLSYMSEALTIGPGESMDAIFTAPEVSSMTRLMLYNRKYSRLSNGGHQGYGGQMTEIHVYPAGTLDPQTEANDWGNPPAL